MTGPLASNSFDVIVLGGGLAGLSAARFLCDQGISTVLLEARNRLGGRVHSHTLSSGQTIDLGAQFIGDVQPSISALVNEAGLTRVPLHRKGKKLYAATKSSPPSRVGHNSLPLSIAGYVDAAQLLFRLERTIQRMDKDTSRAVLDRQPFTSKLREMAFLQETRNVIGSSFGNEMCMSTDSTSTYEVLEQIRSMGGIAGSEASAAYFIKEGASAITDFLASKIGPGSLRLAHPVTAVCQDDSGVTVRTPHGDFRGRKAIIAIPPQLYAAAGVLLHFPERRRKIVSAFVLGKAIKTVLVFEKAWWRGSNLNGAVQCPDSDFQEIIDCSPPPSPAPSPAAPAAAAKDDDDDKSSKNAGILVCFSTSQSAVNLLNTTEEERVQRAVRWLQRMHGTTPTPPLIAARSVDWTAEDWSRGGYASRRGLGGWTCNGQDELFAPAGHLFFLQALRQQRSGGASWTAQCTPVCRRQRQLRKSCPLGKPVSSV